MPGNGLHNPGTRNSGADLSRDTAAIGQGNKGVKALPTPETICTCGDRAGSTGAGDEPDGIEGREKSPVATGADVSPLASRFSILFWISLFLSVSARMAF